MTNLPIISNAPKSPGNAANAAQTNSTADNQATKRSPRTHVKGTPPDTRPAGGLGAGGGALVGGVNSAASTPRPVYRTVDCLSLVQPSAGGGLSTFGVSLADAAEPFAALLARQIGEADSSSTNIAPGTITIDGAAPSLKDKQDQAAIAASTPSDQTDTLTAMLLQLPHEMHTPVANDAASTSTATNNADGIDVSARKPVPRTDAKLDMANTALGNTGAAAIATDKQISADVISQDAVKRVELAASLTQPSPNTTQLITSSTISAVMSNMLTNSRPADTTQTITTPLGNSGWAGDFSQKISWMITQKNQVAELHLNPPDLGPLNVVLKISDNQATALFTSPHSTVREALENAMPKLREILADNGIMLGNTTVSDQSPRDRSAEGFMNQGSGTAAQRGGFSGASESTGLSPITKQVVPARRHNGMVDTFA